MLRMCKSLFYKTTWLLILGWLVGSPFFREIHSDGYLGRPGTGQGRPGNALGQPGTGQGTPGNSLGQPGTGQGIPGSGFGTPGTSYGNPGSSQQPPHSQPPQR